jgi:hypothetical protein
LSASRIIVVMSRMVGKGAEFERFANEHRRHQIRIAKDSENARQTSSSQGGSGRISTTRIAMMPMASARSLRFRNPAIETG